VRQGLRAARAGAWLALVLAAQLIAAPAIAGPFTRLQVLLPGETADPGTGSGKTGTPDAQTAGIPFSITVNACDDSWNLVNTVTHTIRILSSDASASLPAAADLVGGTGSFLVILNAGGNFTVQAHDQSDVTIPDGISSSVRSIVLQSLEFSNIPRDQTAGTAFSASITARDPNGDLVSGFTGTVLLSEVTSFGAGRISPTSVTLTSGQWSGNLTVYRADATSPGTGNVFVSAQVQGHPSQSGTSNSFVVRPAAFRRIQIVMPGQSPLPGSVSGITGVPASQAAGRSFTVNVYATDDYWNQVQSGDAVQLASSTDPADTPVNGTLSGGFRQLSFTFMTVGTQTLTGTDQTNSGITPMTSAGVQVVPNAADNFAFAAIPSPQVAGVPFTVTIRAVDQSGNTVFNYAGDAVLASNTGSGTSTPTLITFVAGVWSGPVTLFGAGSSVRLTCTDFSSPPRTGTSVNITVNPASFTKLQIILPGETAKGGTADGKDGTPFNQMAGTPFTITVRAVDDYWNVVSGIGDRVQLTSTDPFAGVPAETTLVSGQITFPGRLYKSGTQTITAHDLDRSGIGDNTSGVVTVVGGPFARVLVLAPGESPAPGTTNGRTGAAIDQSINYAFTLTVLATDRWWNPVTGPTDVVHIACDDPLAQVPPDQAMVDGRADMPLRLATGGFSQVTVSDVTNPARTGSTTQVRAISSGFHLVASVVPSTARAGDLFTLTVKVTNDAGAVISEINSFVTIEVQNANTQAPGRGTLSTPQFQLLGGQRSISETYTYSEPIVLVAHDDAGNAPAKSNVITVTPGPPSAVRLASSPSWVGGNKHATLTGRVVDAYENGVPDRPVTFALLSGTGTVTPTDSLTDGSGNARADFLSPRQPEIDRIRATSESFSADLDLQVAFVDPAAGGGYVTNFPNPFHPPSEPTTLAYKLDDQASVVIRIYTQSGQLVRRVQFDRGAPGGVQGLNQFVWDGKNGDGQVVASGGYHVLIEAQGPGETLHVIRRKIAVVR
jgi:flagellar hook capping protein FlgD/Big-like domain-containing protein